MKVDPLVRVSHLADAADALGIRISGGGGMTWLGAAAGFAIGPAFTIRQAAIEEGAPPQDLRHREVVESLIEPGQVLVIAVEGDTRGATWGEGHATQAATHGVAGVLVDGWTRDAAYFLRQGAVPLMCRGASPFRSVGRLQTVSIRQDVRVCGQTVRQGDIVAIDPDGFVAFAANDARRLTEKAGDIARREAEEAGCLASPP